MTATRIADTPAAAPRRQPLLSRVPAAFVRSVLKGHSSLGLAFAVAIYVVCLTGTLAVFVREFQRWENPHAPRVTLVTPDAAQAALAGTIAAAGVPIEHAYIYPSWPDRPWLMVSAGAGSQYREWVADGTGRVTGEAHTPWTDFMVVLHTRLHLPHTWGRFLVGLVGVALLSSLISGVLAHPRIFRDAFHLRLGGSRRLQEADLHNRLGVWAMPFHLIVSATGAFLGLTTLVVGVLGFLLFQGDVGKVYSLFFPAEPKDNPAPAPVIDIRPMIAEVARLTPGGRINYIGLEHPTEQGAAAMFDVVTDARGLIHYDTYAFNRDGLYYSSKSRESTLGQKIVAATGPLHFGWFGGGAIKAVYGLLGLAMTHLAASGVTIWLARRRDKGRPAPRWERLWSACVWGQPVALAGSAALAMLAPALGQGALVVAWGSISLAAFALALGGVALGTGGRRATAALLVIAAVAHLLLRQGLSGDPMGWTVDALLVAGAALLLLPDRARLQASRSRSTPA